MSYDVSLCINTGNQEVEIWSGNHTYNTWAMFQKSLGNNGINDLNGKRAGEVVEKLRDAVGYMKSHQDEMETLNPPNGWGNRESALNFLTLILEACERHPLCVIRVT